MNEWLLRVDRECVYIFLFFFFSLDVDMGVDSLTPI